MALATKSTSGPRWVATVRSGATLAEDILHRGEKVGPRTGLEKRMQGDEDDYVLRRILIAWRETGDLKVPLVIEAECTTDGEPDFRLRWPDHRVTGLEVTQAGEEAHQRAMTEFERRPGVLHMPEEESEQASTARTVEQLATALGSKIEKFAKGAYRRVESCELAIYDNTAWGGFLDKRGIIEGLRRSNRAGSDGFSRVHIVFESDVFLDVFGDMRRVSLLRRYESDYVGWTLDQADRLRSMSTEGVDAPHLAEEIEDLGKSDRRALASHLNGLLLHLLKWQFQPEKRSASWQSSVRMARRAIHKLLTESPSLTPLLDDMIEDEYSDARHVAAEETRLPIETFPVVNPYSRSELRDLDYLPNNGDGA